MRTYVNSIATMSNGVTGLGFVSADVSNVIDVNDSHLHGRYLVQFAPTFDPASGELNGAQETADGGRIVFITYLNGNDVRGWTGDTNLNADKFDAMLPAIARAWAEQRRESNDAWFAAATAQRAELDAAAN